MSDETSLDLGGSDTTFNSESNFRSFITGFLFGVTRTAKSAVFSVRCISVNRRLWELFSRLEFPLTPGFDPCGGVQDSSQIQDGRLSGDVQKLSVDFKPAVFVFSFRLPSVEDGG